MHGHLEYWQDFRQNERHYEKKVRAGMKHNNLLIGTSCLDWEKHIKTLQPSSNELTPCREKILAAKRQWYDAVDWYAVQKCPYLNQRATDTSADSELTGLFDNNNDE